MTKQEVLNKAWYKLIDAIGNVKQLNQLSPLLMEMKAAIDIEEVPKDEKVLDTHKRLFNLEGNDDMVNNPSHYQSMVKDLSIDCITAMRAAFGDYEAAIFCKLNAFKYIWRASSKNGNEDISKASWYLNKYKELGGENQ
jgi:hypothetical protein